LFLLWFCAAALPVTCRIVDDTEKYDPVEQIHLLLGDIPTFWT